MRKRTMGLATAVLVACGSGDGDGGSGASDEFEGLYEMTSNTVNYSSCDAEGEPVDDGDAFFKLKVQAFFGQKVLNYVACSSATTCDDANEDEDTINLGEWSLSEKDAGVWTGESSSVGSSGLDGDPCNLNLTLTSASRDADGNVTFEQKRQSGSVDQIDGKKCVDTHDELIEMHRATLPCTTYKKFVGKPVASE